MKTFKHPKLWRIARPAKDDDIRVKELIIWKYDLFIKEWSYDLVNNHRMSAETLLALWFEEIKDNHFWNWMISWWDWCYINTTKTIKQYHRYETVDWDILSGCIDWSIFQTKEQAQQFDKMMMTVWKIWKWKKENDDTEWWEYSLYYNRQKKKFGWADYSIEYKYGFFLPRFSSSNDVHRLISDLWEELNNLLCWIK